MTSVPRVGVVRLDALGDTLLSTPAIDYLQREIGPENVLVLASPGLSGIFGDSIFCREVDPSCSEQQVADMLDEFGATIVFVFSEKKRALKAAYLSKAAQKIGFDPGWSQPIRSLEVKRFLTLRFPIINSLESSSRYHEVERYTRLVGKGLAQKWINGTGLRLFGLPERRSSPNCEAPIGFQWTRKWLQDGWPEAFLSSLVESLPKDTIIFVAPSELAWARSRVPGSRQDNLVCYPDLLEYAQAIEKCRYLVSVDTGAVHVAAAVGTAVIDVFPESGAQHTVPRWRPWMTSHQIVLKPSYEEGAEAEFWLRMAAARQAMESVLEWSQTVAKSG